MKIFKDALMTQEVEILDLGIVPAGETKKYTYYVVNDIMALVIELSFVVDHKEVIVVKAPETLKYLEKAELHLSWTPSIDIKQGLKTSLQISGKELYK